jgi:hypothetical protein
MSLSLEDAVNSNMGMKTREWGPGAWKFLFSTIMGAYPAKYDKKNREHRKTKKYFYYMFKSLSYTMGCVFCRNSYAQFWKELPIKHFMDSRINFMYWLYLLKDKVNKKLIKQENEKFASDIAKLKLELISGKITNHTYTLKLRTVQQTCFRTTPSPPFRNVLLYYQSMRAPCSKQAQTCN